MGDRAAADRDRGKGAGTMSGGVEAAGSDAEHRAMSEDPAPVFACDLCAEPAISIAPGHEAATACDLFRVERGTPRRQWCLACWPAMREAA